jgi:hypothetical protein
MSTGKPTKELSWVVRTHVFRTRRVRSNMLRGIIKALVIASFACVGLQWCVPSMRDELRRLWQPALFVFGGFVVTAFLLVPLDEVISRVFPTRARVGMRGVSIGIRTLATRDIVGVEIETDLRRPRIRRLCVKSKSRGSIRISLPPEVDDTVLKEVFGHMLGTRTDIVLREGAAPPQAPHAGH